MKKLISALLIVAICGCTTLYSSIVTLTQLRHNIMNQYGELYRANMIRPEVDYKITKADEQFRAAAAAMEVVLVHYKAGTATDADVQKKLTEVKLAIASILTLIEPYIVVQQTAKFQNQLATATKL